MSSDDHIVLFRRIPAELRSPVYERFARRLRREVARGRSYQCLITTDADLRRLNRDFRGRDYATDVLSFPSAGDDGLGDIAISLQRARAQAARYGHAIEKEICVLILHGVLHLMGHDHESDSGRMARAEKRWRRALGLPGGLIERVSP